MVDDSMALQRPDLMESRQDQETSNVEMCEIHAWGRNFEELNLTSPHFIHIYIPPSSLNM